MGRWAAVRESRIVDRMQRTKFEARSPLFYPVTISVASAPGAGLTRTGPSLTLSMKRQMFSWALLACIATGALFLSGCSTVSSRIEKNQDAFTQLSPQDQALVREGRIRG